MKSEIKLTILIFYILLLGVSLFLPFYIFDNIFSDKTEVYFFDVGQGDSSLIITPSKNYILIDGGPDNTVVYKLGKYLPFFNRKIDLVIITHPHDDHLVGLIAVLNRYDVKMILMTNAKCLTATCMELERIITEKNIQIQWADYRGVMNWDKDLNFEVFLPDGRQDNEKNLNNYSVVGRMTIGDRSLIFMGDQEKEELLIGEDIESQVIKAGHHGSANANDCKFLTDVKPEYAIISVGQNNKFGHPQPKTLECLNDLNVKILRTDLIGDIHFSIDENSIILDN